MIRSNKNIYKEYLYPNDRFKDFWMRIILTISVILVLVYIIIRVLHIAQSEPTVYLIILILGVVFPIIIIWIVKDCVTYFKSVSTSYKSRAKLIITHQGVSIYVGRRLMQKMLWSEIDIIEKTIYYDEKVIILVKNFLEEKVVKCYSKEKNFIMFPHRLSIDNAIRKFSKRRVEVTPKDINRFAKY